MVLIFGKVFFKKKIEPSNCAFLFNNNEKKDFFFFNYTLTSHFYPEIIGVVSNNIFKQTDSSSQST